MNNDILVPHTPLTIALITDDICPRCLEDLDTGWECIKCDYDALPHIEGFE